MTAVPHTDQDSPTNAVTNDPAPPPPSRPTESGGPPGPEPTRYGDWEKGGRCSSHLVKVLLRTTDET